MGYGIRSESPAVTISDSYVAQIFRFTHIFACQHVIKIIFVCTKSSLDTARSGKMPILAQRVYLLVWNSGMKKDVAINDN